MPIPNAERAILGFLRSNLAVPAYQTPPPGPPSTYLRVHRVGGIPRDLVTDLPMITISAYAEDAGVAADLANRVRDLLTTVPGHWLPTAEAEDRAVCRGWREAAGPSHYPDPDRPDRVRYQFSGELALSTNR